MRSNEVKSKARQVKSKMAAPMRMHGIAVQRLFSRIYALNGSKFSLYRYEKCIGSTRNSVYERVFSTFSESSTENEPVMSSTETERAQATTSRRRFGRTVRVKRRIDPDLPDTEAFQRLPLSDVNVPADIQPTEHVKDDYFGIHEYQSQLQVQHETNLHENSKSKTKLKEEIIDCDALHEKFLGHKKYKQNTREKVIDTPFGAIRFDADNKFRNLTMNHTDDPSQKVKILHSKSAAAESYPQDKDTDTSDIAEHGTQHHHKRDSRPDTVKGKRKRGKVDLSPLTKNMENVIKMDSDFIDNQYFSYVKDDKEVSKLSKLSKSKNENKHEPPIAKLNQVLDEVHVPFEGKPYPVTKGNAIETTDFIDEQYFGNYESQKENIAVPIEDVIKEIVPGAKVLNNSDKLLQKREIVDNDPESYIDNQYFGQYMHESTNDKLSKVTLKSNEISQNIESSIDDSQASPQPTKMADFAYENSELHGKVIGNTEIHEPVTRRDEKSLNKPKVNFDNPKTAYDLAMKLRLEKKNKEEVNRKEVPNKNGE